LHETVQQALSHLNRVIAGGQTGGNSVNASLAASITIIPWAETEPAELIATRKRTGNVSAAAIFLDRHLTKHNLVASHLPLVFFFYFSALNSTFNH
jgi:hypothetical protein